MIFQRHQERDDIPAETHETLVRYIQHGVPTGHFLHAVLVNDLKEAVSRADSINLAALPLIVKWLYGRAPSKCWGTHEKVAAWRRAGRSR